MDEWLEYYNNVSMSIDDDEYFALMMNNAWNLDGKKVTKKGWAGEYWILIIKLSLDILLFFENINNI